MIKKIVSELVLTTLLVCTLMFVFNVKLLEASGTIYWCIIIEKVSGRKEVIWW